MSDKPSVSVLAGQIGYLLEERPELRGASSAAIARQLDHEDRYARARARYPLETDDEVRAHIDEFESRITAADVDAALFQMQRRHGAD